MRKFFQYLLILLTSLAMINAKERIEINFNRGWKFYLGDLRDAFKIDFNEKNWEKVRLPHDWAIKGPFDPNGDPGTGKLPWKGVGWYRKLFEIPDSYRDKIIYILFEGVMANPTVYVNGDSVGGWDYGYNSFYFNITKYLKPGDKNLIAVRVDTREHESRWYPGAGIYRNVKLIVVNKVHVDIWGTFVTNPEINEDYAITRVETRVNNFTDSTLQVKVITKIINPDGKEVTTDTVKAFIYKMRYHKFSQTLKINKPILWDINNPKLYMVKSFIFANNELHDVHITKFGIRTIKFTTKNGFFLNGRRLWFKGVNFHHDFGPLGAAFHRSVMKFRLEQLKDMGVNAIRTSHNVQAPELLELCDEMGFLVINEIFDKWDKKADFKPSMDFYEFAERNVRNFVKRDRNHPCVVIWSVGNEVWDLEANENNMIEKLEKMVEYFRKYDPTRPITLVTAGTGNIVKWRHFDYFDIHSYNYQRRYYEAYRIEPKPVIITESASTTSTRGFYKIPLPKEKTDFFTPELQVSSYDLNGPFWCDLPDEGFNYVETDTFVCGEFIWTGFDYLGEPTPYDNWYGVEVSKKLKPEQTARSSYFGIIDLAGIPKDRYYLYRSHWRDDVPTVHILPHWNWEGYEGEEIPVFVYTNGDQAELFLNGKSLGKKSKIPVSENLLERYRLMWNVKYEPGELKAVAYKNGNKIGEAIVNTASQPYKIRLTPLIKKIKSNGDDFAFILVEAVDKKGISCPHAMNIVNFKITGPGMIAGIANGNPQSYESFIDPKHSLFYGKAMLIVRSVEGKCGKIKIVAKSEGLKKGIAFIESK
ncbi:MAG: glycoside hydrolase family 2 protein [Candidatus Marinimicrobia bacterium]|nr:glycoside hydrolase family 2 protein [Candidatus Neomarinimicrobiota bacterium]